MEANNLSDAEFKTLLNELRGRVDELNEDFNKEIGNMKMKLENITKRTVSSKDYINKNEEYIKRNQQWSKSRGSNQRFGR